jgi:hypothetical protein
VVYVHVTPSEDSSDADEVAWAHRLGRELKEEFRPFEDGDIVIHAKASAYGYGQRYNDIDVVVVGRFPNGIDRQIDCIVNVKDDGQRRVQPSETIRFYSIIMTIEIKSHDPRSVRVVGLNDLQVLYSSGWKSATDQSEGQKAALRAVLSDKVGPSCWVCNGIWLTSFDRSALPQGVTNVLPKLISLTDLLRLCCAQKAPFQRTPAQSPIFSALPQDTAERCDASVLKGLLTSMRRVEVQSLGALSRQKLEFITANLLRDQPYANVIGNQLLIIPGKPGTGKTIKLLRLAHHLAARDGARVRILTYNLALVSDIRRLLALSGINEEAAGIVDIGSLDKFFYELIVTSGLSAFDYDRYFETKDRMLLEILEAFDIGLVTASDIREWLAKPEFRYDYVFVDEGQDWSSLEQRILLKVFGPAKVVVGDGIDQMVRTQNRSDWIENVASDSVHRVPPERRCLRQKYNLNEYNRALARATDRTWDLESRTEFPGGRIIIATGGYDRTLHEKLWEECQLDGNKGYEMLFMVPPSLANAGRGFSQRETFESWGVKLWDGTMRDARKEFPTDLLEHRVIQYESCRGLEAWTGICMGLDEIFELKQRLWKPFEDQVSLEDDDVLRAKDAYKWCMIPLTRAIDTTVVTLTDANSTFSRKLIEVAESMPDVAQVV